MRIALEYWNPTKTYCNVSVRINGEFVGILTLRQEMIIGFDQIVSHGCRGFSLDSFVAHGVSTFIEKE